MFNFVANIANLKFFANIPPGVEDMEGKTLEKIDDYTVKWSFVDAYGIFIPWMASTRYNWCFSTYPKHYLSQFHPSYTDPATVQAMAAEEGFDDWLGLHGNRRDWRNVDLPCNRIWMPDRMPPDIPSSVVRNPYYWVVDPEGPDIIEYHLVPDATAYTEVGGHSGSEPVTLDIGVATVTLTPDLLAG